MRMVWKVHLDRLVAGAAAKQQREAVVQLRGFLRVQVVTDWNHRGLHPFWDQSRPAEHRGAGPGLGSLGAGARYQHGTGRHLIWVLGGYTSADENGETGCGVRSEMVVKF